MGNKIDYYELLEVTRDADGEEIKRSYRSLAMKYHPDRNQGNLEAEAKFKEVCEAYEILKDDQKRAAYDKYGHSAFSQGGGGAGFGGFGGMDLGEMFSDLFRDFMGGNAGGNSHHHNNQGSDLRYDLQITLEEAFSGINKEIEIVSPRKCEDCDGSGMGEDSKHATCNECGGNGKIRVRQMFMIIESVCPRCRGRGETISNPCKKCKGEGRSNQKRTLKVDIPAGVDIGNRIRLAGEGEAGIRGAINGDLYIVIHIKEHKFFSRDRANVFGDIPIPMTTAAIGGEVKIPTLDGQGYVMKIPKGTQHGEQIRIKQLGMPALRGGTCGDMYVRINIEIPTKLSKKQEELLREFENESAKNHPGVAGFWDKLKDLF